MIQSAHLKQFSAKRHLTGLTLAEVLVCIAIIVMVLVVVTRAYIQSARRAEWSGYSLAAQALAVEYAEQLRAANWDSQANPVVDQTTNLTSSMVSWTSPSTGVWTGWATNQMDLPVSGTNVLVVTNYVTVSNITNSNNAFVSYKMIRVDTVWPFSYGNISASTNAVRYYSNTVVTYRAPSQ